MADEQTAPAKRVTDEERRVIGTAFKRMVGMSKGYYFDRLYGEVE